MGEDYGTLLDNIMPVPAGDSLSPFLQEAEEQEKVVSPTRNGIANGTASQHEAGAPGALPTNESHGVASEEATDNSLVDGVLSAPDVLEGTLNEESDGLGNFSTVAAAVHAPGEDEGEESLETPLQEIELEAILVQTNESTQQGEEAPALLIVEERHDETMQETDGAPSVVIVEQSHVSAIQGADEAPAVIVGGAEEVSVLIVEKQEEVQVKVQVQDVMDASMDLVQGQDEIPATSGDEQQNLAEVAVPQGGDDDVKEELAAHRSDVLGSLSKLDDNTARQLLNDYGWNVSQSVRQNGKTQWYYRSPPPKPVLVGSLTSAVALWKKLVDDEHKRKGVDSGNGDLYPMVTAFLDNVKRPSGRKRKRGRYSE